MRKILVFAIAVTMVACSPSPKNENLAELTARRDSLQKEQSSIETQLNAIEAQIAEADTTINPDDLKILKQITMQKNKIVKIDKKIIALENKMTAKDQKILLPVAVKEMQNEQFDHYIIAFGEVEAKNYAMISPEMNGRIEKIYVKRGQRVSKGSLLVILNTDALDKQITGVKNNIDFATTTYNKQEALWNEGIGSEIDFLATKNTKETLESQLESLEAQIRMSQIRAPFDGIVDKIFPKEGEMAGPAFPVIEFVNLKTLTIKADVSEAYVNKIVNGQIVELSFASLPDYIIKTPVIQVSNVIESTSRTFEIEMEINNTGEKIKPNMVSTIHINDFSSNKAFVVPSLVIRKDISGNYVYVVNKVNNLSALPSRQAGDRQDETIVGKKYVSTGLSYDENTVISKGLNAGDKVIVKGFHLVSAGVPVNVVE